MGTTVQFDTLPPNEYVEQEGQFLFAITDVKLNPKKNDGTLADAFKLYAEVMSGTVPGHATRKFSDMFYFPRASHKDRGQMAKRKINNLLVATGIRPAKIDNGKVFLDETHGADTDPFDLDDLKGRLFVTFVKNDSFTGRDGETLDSFKIDGTNIYHIDDVRVAHVPKDEESIKLFRNISVAPRDVTEGIASGAGSAMGIL